MNSVNNQEVIAMAQSIMAGEMDSLCVICEENLTARQLAVRSTRSEQAGPFCSRRCSGAYRRAQNKLRSSVADAGPPAPVPFEPLSPPKILFDSGMLGYSPEPEPQTPKTISADGSFYKCPAIILAGGEEFAPDEEDMIKWRHTYPFVDVQGEIEAMGSWSLANVPKRKTRRGVKRFINAWLSRAQAQQAKEAARPKKDGGWLKATRDWANGL